MSHDLDPALLLFSPEGADRPHDAYRELRAQCPVHRSDFNGSPSVYVSRFEDAMWALRHPEVFSSSAEALDMGQDQPLIPLQVDPPEHTQYRRLLNPEFVPREIAKLEPDVRTLVNGLLDGFADKGECDFHEDFATPLPSTVFLALMGMPQDDLETFLRWRDQTIRPDVEPGDFEGAARIREQTSHEITAYFEGFIDEKQRNPDDRLLTRIINASIDGRRLDRAELLGICHLLLLGGLDTVTATLDCMIGWLAEHPIERQKIVDDPGLVPSAVEELLRHQTPVMIVPRIIKQDVTMGGVDLKVGDGVTVVLGAANSDDDEFDDAESVDLTRDPNRHVAFGAGNHLCLGAHLARLELRVALEEFHRRIPDYRLADGTELHFSPGIRQVMNHLPLVW